MRIDICHLLSTSILLCLCVIFSCKRDYNVHQQDSFLRNTFAENDSLQKLWTTFIKSGKTSDLCTYADSLFKKYNNVGMAKRSIYPAVYLATAYIYENNRDSAKKYLDFLDSNIVKDNPPYGMFNNAMAEYAVKYEADYSKALKYLKQAYEYHIKTEDRINQALILNNISILYLQKSDTTGYDYALKAYQLSSSVGDPYSKCMSTITLSRMEYLTGKFEEALRHCDEAMSYIMSHNGLRIQQVEAYLTAGDIYTAKDDLHKADSCFSKAFWALERIGDESVHTKLYLSYGDFLFKSGRPKEARDSYLSGIRIAENSNSIDNVYMLYLGLSKAYESLGDKDNALYYYKKYYEASTAAFNHYKEKEFNQLLNDYEKIKYEKDLQQKELEISNSRKTIIIISAILAITLVVTLALVYTYKKKDRMYTILVRRHQQSLRQIEYIEKLGTEKSENEDSKSQSEIELFNRLENLMKTGKMFKETELTLDKIAAELDSNRTYVSSVINKYSGMTFPNYLNKYRINEAISIISDPDTEVVLKAVCREIGYKSMSAFYRAFQKETGCTPSVYRDKVIMLKKNGCAEEIE